MVYPSSELVIDPVLIQRCDVTGPRYTSNPTADRFVEAFGEKEFRQFLAQRNVGWVNRPLSLYVQIPFCDTICFYCDCNKVVTRDPGKAVKYVDYLTREIEQVGRLLGSDRRACQLHWGGGTPTFLSDHQIARVMQALAVQFQFEDAFECAIEVDPRRLAPGRIAYLSKLGFNRLSIGMQDFDPRVQRAVNRVQSQEQTGRVMQDARAAGFRSVNLSLIYGLPRQSLDSFSATLDTVIELDPDRIALYNYAHRRQIFKPQRRIEKQDLPSPETALQIVTLAVGRLTRAGYYYIGMDHFAKPEDDLAVAQRQGRLQCNFQGYSIRADSDLLSFGISAIGSIGPSYYQNVKRLDEYYAALDGGRLPVWRGIELSQDDLVRREVIQALACQFRVSIEAIEVAYLIDFKSYFATELKELNRLSDDGLVELTPEWIEVTPKGRMLVRVVCMVFDRYLRQFRQQASYSRVL